MSGNNNTIVHQQTMRILGGIALVASIIQIGCAGAAYSLTSWHVGSWWAGLIAFFAAVCAVISNSKPVVITGCAFSVLGVILLFIGTILDGVFYGVMENLDTCYSRYTNEIYGDSSYSPYAKACAVDHSQDCSCITSDNTDDCYLFDLKAANDCGEVLTTLPSDLLASMFFCLLLLIVVFTYSIFTCMTVCCSPENDVYIQDNNNGPAPGSQPPVAAAYPHYAQQQTPVAQAYVQPPPTVKAVPATTSTTNPMARAGDV